MIDINEAPDKTAATLERFLENCRNEDPYIQNIYMAARHLVTAGLGHCEYQTQYASGTTLWGGAGSHHSIPRILYQSKKQKWRKAALVLRKGARLLPHTLKLLVAAREVIRSWENGDLAAAVRNLEAVIKEIEAKFPRAGRLRSRFTSSRRMSKNLKK
jgi:hypothetical protein